MAGELCTAYCTLANQCSDLRLVKNYPRSHRPCFENHLDGDIYLGSTGNVIPSSAWFNFDEVGDAPLNVTALGVDGLAVERTATALAWRLSVIMLKSFLITRLDVLKPLVLRLAPNRNTTTGWA